MAERTLKTWNHANKCTTCTTPTLATHSTTDSQELLDGSFIQTKPRFGCDAHPVFPLVLLMDGSTVPFSKYVVSPCQ